MENGGKGTPTRTRELLERWLAGDGTAERRLFERYRATLVERAERQRWMRGVARHASVEDLVDEVFLRVFASGALREFECRGAGSLERFLSSVLHSVATDVLRRHGRGKHGGGRPDLSLEWMAWSGPSERRIAATDTTPTQNARAGELMEIGRAVLSELEWNVFVSCELESRSSAEVGERLGRSDAAVRGVLHRARKKLSLALAQRAGPKAGARQG